MKILISAFSCGPHRGSEEGVGWNWVVQAAGLGHEVVVLTQTELQAEIEAEIATGRLPPTVRFVFVMPGWIERLRRTVRRIAGEGIAEHLTHLAWQIILPRHARRCLADEQFDLIHHITYSGIRHPTLLGRLSVPLALGPLGGGERAPWALRRGLGWRGWLLDAVRDLHTFLIRFDPITRRACADALVIYVKTEQSRQALPARYHDKVVVHLEIGTREVSDAPRPERRPGEPLRLLFAGRFLYWKGMHLGLRGLAEVLARGVDARLTMLGQGPDEAAWRRLAQELGIEQAIDWLAWVDHHKVGELYRRHDALLFPSLHDSSGNVVLEALVHGLPVVCLDLGGPAVMVDASCGRVVATEGLDVSGCARAIADALEELAGSDRLLAGLSDGARARARRFRWSTVVGSLYEDVARRLEGQEARAATGPSGDRIPARHV